MLHHFGGKLDRARPLFARLAFNPDRVQNRGQLAGGKCYIDNWPDYLHYFTSIQNLPSSIVF
jgi:hypothetical protein